MVIKWSALFFGAALVIVAPSVLKAASGDELNIAPALQEVIVTGTDITKPVTVTVANSGPSSRTYKLSVVDFGSLGESGGLAFLGQTANESEHRFGLSPWVQAPATVNVAARSSSDVVITIENRTTLSPGGHYAAVIVTPVDQASKPKQVQLQQQLASLILLRKTGGEQYRFGVSGQSFNSNWLKLPGSINLRVANSGNVHVVPRGLIRLVDPRGEVVYRATINQGSSFILPGSVRNFNVTLMKQKNALWPGKYLLLTQTRNDGSDSVQTIKKEIWYLGYIGVIAIVALVGLALLAIVAIWLIRKRKPRPKIPPKTFNKNVTEKVEEELPPEVPDTVVTQKPVVKKPSPMRKQKVFKPTDGMRRTTKKSASEKPKK